MSPTTIDTLDELDIDSLLDELNELIEKATSSESEGDFALAIRSIAW